MRDLRALLRLRTSALGRHRGRLRMGVALVLIVTVGFAVGPAFADPATLLPRFGPDGLRPHLRALLPAFLLISLLSTVGNGGGREVLAKEQAVAFPITPATDHLGALVMAPLNLAWFVQSWMLLAIVGALAGPTGLLPGVVLAVVWMACATAIAQAIGWAIEWLRRGPQGRLVVPALGITLAGASAGLQVSGRWSELAAGLPTNELAQVVADLGVSGPSLAWVGWVLGLGLTTLVAIVAGIPLAAAVAARPTRDVERADARRHAPRSAPRSAAALLRRADRDNVLRSVPLRRGLALLVALPSVMALVRPPDWSVLTLIVGMVVSGAALLFGVNAWCIDGRGQLWRESLPAPTTVFFDARARLVLELLGGSALVTLAVASLRASRPSTGEALAIAAMVVVSVVQVTAAALRWSVRTPHPADMRSARAIPAPPMAMMGYSAKLSLTTTLTGLAFGALGSAGAVPVILGATAALLTWSTTRLWLARRAFARPAVRARITVTVAA